jgi:uncharacterized protein (DUF983 family)
VGISCKCSRCGDLRFFHALIIEERYELHFCGREEFDGPDWGWR